MKHTKILLVENQHLLREAVAELIRSMLDGVEVFEAEDGIAAMSVLRASRPDLAVIDGSTPHINGVATSQRLRAAHPSLAIIFLTEDRSLSTVREVFTAGANGYLLKSDSTDVLIDAIRAVLGGDKYLSPEIKGLSGSFLEADHSTGKGIDLSSVLTRRQVEVLALLASGMSIREISDQIGLSTKTLDSHRREIHRRLGINSIAEVTRYALQEGLIDLDGKVNGSSSAQ